MMFFLTSMRANALCLLVLPVVGGGVSEDADADEESSPGLGSPRDAAAADARRFHAISPRAMFAPVVTCIKMGGGGPLAVDAAGRRFSSLMRRRRFLIRVDTEPLRFLDLSADFLADLLDFLLVLLAFDFPLFFLRLPFFFFARAGLDVRLSSAIEDSCFPITSPARTSSLVPSRSSIDRRRI